MQWLLAKIVGTKNERELRRLWPIVRKINEIEQTYQSLPEEALRAKTAEFRQRVQSALREGPLAARLRELREALASAIDDREKRKIKREIRAVYHSVLDPLLPEAFAVVKNACRRLLGRPIQVCGHTWTWDMVPFDVQLLGGVVLHEGKIAEMATGEGKTLVATLPAYLNALTGCGVHVVTVNDFLARRDAQWMGALYQYLGLTVGCIQNAMPPSERRAQYACDITYGTNSEFGFDYLRDKGLAYRPEEQVQRGYFYAIVDEVDSILIDEARTPLIISGPAPYPTRHFAELKGAVERLWRRQRDLCTRLLQEAKRLLEQEHPDAGLHLWLVKRGHPKNKQLLHLLEDPSVRRLLEQTENQLMSKATEFESLQFSAADLARPEALATRLREHADPLTAYLWKKLPRFAQRLLEDYAGEKLEGQRGVAIKDVLLDALNAARHDPELYRPERFEGVKLSAETQELAAREDLATLERIRLNVRLLEEAFAGEMAKQGVDGVNKAIELSEELYFTIDEKGHDAHLTSKGCEAISPDDPSAYVLPDLPTALAELDGDTALSREERFERRQRLQEEFAEKSERIHAVNQLIRAYSVFERDVDYVVQNNQVIIVDEFTGRLMPGRRWSDGLHQAIEAKEGVEIERETQTLATITIQNYFRMYEKLAGMTGTAATEADEFHHIYGLDVVVIPTNRPVRRIDLNDLVYKTQREKYNAILEEIEDCYRRGQPVLVGTISVEVSELISRMLKRRNIPHNVLNAKNHEREADIVANAGQKGAVTIATNMAGRGTDIKLGEGVVYLPREVIESSLTLNDKYQGRRLRDLLMEKPCGLHVIGTTRHEARRIDRQLRGRCARQGDPGSSRFYVSLEDDLMRLFGSDRVARIMEKLGLQEGEVLEHPWLNRSIENAQRRVEQHNFAIRRRTLEYDDVMNKQREVIYGFRSEVVASPEPREQLLAIAEDVVLNHATEAVRSREPEALEAFAKWVNDTFPVGVRPADLEAHRHDAEALTRHVMQRVRDAYELKASLEDPEALREMERFVILQVIDAHWQEFLRNMDSLREGVGLRAYGQHDPLVEYKREAYGMFSDMMDQIKSDIAQRMFRAATSVQAMRSFLMSLPQMYVHEEVQVLGQTSPAAVGAGTREAEASVAGETVQAALRATAPIRRATPKVGRNDPCPCGSGKKYKKCCGAQR